MRHFIVLLVTLLSITQAHAYCFNYAAARYHQNPLVVEAIALWESSLNAQAIGKNRDSTGNILSRDYCLMQINSVNVQALKKMGVINSAQDLLNDPCLCVQAGAWVLAKHLRHCGNTWSCLGSYNAGFSQTPLQEKRRLAYADQIHAIYNRLVARNTTLADR